MFIEQQIWILDWFLSIDCMTETVNIEFVDHKIKSKYSSFTS